MLMSYRVDNGLWQLCGWKVLWNWSSGKHIQLKVYHDQFIYSKVPGSNLGLVLQFKQIDEAEILP